MKAKNWLWKAVQTGMIGGAVVVFLSLVGMVARFSERSIIEGVIDLGRLLVIVVFFVAGYQAAPEEPTPVQRVVSGLLAGLVAAAVVALLILVGGKVDLRSIFINASPELYEILTFGGLPRLFLIGAATGLVAALLGFVPLRLRRALFAGLTTTVILGTLSDQLLLILNNHHSAGLFKDRSLAPKGVTVSGAIILTVVVALITYIQGLPVTQASTQTIAKQPWAPYLATLAGIALLIYLPQFVGTYHSEVLNQVGLYVLMGLGLNIVVGFTGMLDLGYVAFFALGAYTMAIFTSSEGFLYSHVWNFWTVLPVALIVAVVAGVILGIPVLRIRGDYLAIITLGFGEIIRLLALSEWLRPYTGGAQGVASIPPISLAILAPIAQRVVDWLGIHSTPPIDFVKLLSISGPDKPQKLFYLVAICCLVAAFVSIRLKHSRVGRAWMAVREDEDVAEAIGIQLVPTKLLAFAVGAAFSGLSGVIFATKLGSIYPHSFSLLISINILALIIVGGLGSIPGVILGALVLVGLPELLREFSEFRLMVYGAVLIFMMQQRPEGLWPDRSAELVKGEAAPPEPEPSASMEFAKE